MAATFEEISTSIMTWASLGKCPKMLHFTTHLLLQCYINLENIMQSAQMCNPPKKGNAETIAAVYLID